MLTVPWVAPGCVVRQALLQPSTDQPALPASPVFGGSPSNDPLSWAVQAFHTNCTPPYPRLKQIVFKMRTHIIYSYKPVCSYSKYLAAFSREPESIRHIVKKHSGRLMFSRQCGQKILRWLRMLKLHLQKALITGGHRHCCSCLPTPGSAVC